MINLGTIFIQFCELSIINENITSFCFIEIPLSWPFLCQGSSALTFPSFSAPNVNYFLSHVKPLTLSPFECNLSTFDINVEFP